jgi:hypothetical protein
MKKKFTRIMGVGLAVMLLSSLLVAATPASAGTLVLSSEKDVPKDVNAFLSPYAGANISALAVNGDTIYAAVPGGTTGNVTYKSTDAGVTWNDLTTTTDYPSGARVLLVAVAPDDADIVAIVASNQSVYYSVDGGNRWHNLDVPATGATVNAVDISAEDSDGYHYIAVGGTDGTDAELYTMKLAMAENWQARTGYTDASGNFTGNQAAIYAVKFSPNYQTDRIITVISGNTSGNDAYFQAFRNEEDYETWNGGIVDFNSWAGTTSANGTNIDDIATLSGGVAAASISLAPTYDGTDEGERVAFVGVADGSSGGGACRIVDNYVKGFETWAAGPEGPIGSVAYHDDGKVLAGNYNENKVYIWLDPMATDPKAERINNLKQPGGTAKTVVAWSGDTAIAATSGDESAFAISTDDAYSFNDISLIDTTIAAMDDVAVNADGSKIYLTTHDSSGDTSVWLKASSWKRVLSKPGLNAATTARFLARIAPEDDSVIYVSSKNSYDMWVSKNSGEMSWKHVPCRKLNNLIQDFVVESADVVYAIDTNSCSKTINAGSSWGTAETLDLSAGTGFMITLAPNNDILVGSSNGYVSFSKDGGDTFTKILDMIDDASSEKVYVVADQDYAENNIIYAAAGDEVERGKADENYRWLSRESADMTGTVTGIAQYKNVIYVLVGGSNQLWRALELKTADTGALAKWGYRSTSSHEVYDAEPNALKISPDYKTDQPKLWMIDTSVGTDADDAGRLLLESISDPIAVSGPTPKEPASGYLVTMNPETGKAHNVAFTFERYSNKYITGVQLQIASDPGFTALVYNQSFTGIDEDTISEVVGPTGTTTTTTQAVSTTSVNQTITIYNPDGSVNQTQNLGPATSTTSETVNIYRQADFMPGVTYYWRVRVNEAGGGDPLLSPWAEGGSFSVEDVAAPVFKLTSPEDGATGVAVTPTFVWTEYEGAIGYEIMVAEDSTFAIVDFSRSVDSNFFKTDEALAYDTTYYWKVRGVTGVSTSPKKAAPGGPWVTGIFTTMEKPVKEEPTVIVQEKPAPPPEIVKVEVPVPQPQPIPSYLLWAIIGIGAVLIIALIVLIVRTRRVV